MHFTSHAFWTALTGLVVGVMIGIALPIPTPEWAIRHFFWRHRNSWMITEKGATELLTANLNYYSEYKHLPVGFGCATKDGDEVIFTTGTTRYISVLAADTDPRAGQPGAQSIQFLSASLSDFPWRPGAFRDPLTGNLALHDSWGNPYRVILDKNNDEVVRFLNSHTGETDVYDTIVVSSAGPDGFFGPDANGYCDDLHIGKVIHSPNG